MTSPTRLFFKPLGIEGSYFGYKTSLKLEISPFDTNIRMLTILGKGMQAEYEIKTATSEFKVPFIDEKITLNFFKERENFPFFSCEVDAESVLVDLEPPRTSRERHCSLKVHVKKEERGSYTASTENVLKAVKPVFPQESIYPKVDRLPDSKLKD